MRSPIAAGGSIRPAPDRVLDTRLDAELVRARRSGAPVAVVVLLDDDRAGGRGRRGRTRAALQLVEDTVRRYDLVVEADDRDRLLVLAPETAADDAQALTERLSAVTGRRGGCACFPADGRSAAALVAQADQAAHRSLQPAR